MGTEMSHTRLLIRIGCLKMSETQLITQLIARLDRNQMAPQAGLEEVSLWIRQSGSEDVAGNINGALETLNQNADFIAQSIAELSVSAGIGIWGKR